MGVTLKRRCLWCICCEILVCGNKQYVVCIVYWVWIWEGVCADFCVYVHWSGWCLWQAVMAQPIKWWVTSKGIVCRHVCHPAIICHSCASRCSIKPLFRRCHYYTTCAAAWLYRGLVHTIESPSQDIFLLISLSSPFPANILSYVLYFSLFSGCCLLLSSLTSPYILTL